MGKSISEIWQEVQDKYKLGLEQSLQQGSTVPLTETMKATATDIKDRYGIDINDLLNISKEDVSKLNFERVKSDNNDSPKVDLKKYVKPAIYGVSAIVVLLIAIKLIKK